MNEEMSETVIPLLFQLINFLGFTPYKPDSYLKEIYGKTIPEVRAMNISGKQLTQLAIHNMLHITWLKRLESSMMALQKSVKNYQHRIGLFEKWLEKGFIVALGDAALLENEYGEDIDRAFEDYEQYLKELEEAVVGDEELVKKRGIEKKDADPEIYNLEQLRHDLERDKKITNLLVKLLEMLTKEGFDEKLKVFANHLAETIQSGKYGKRCLCLAFSQTR